MKKFLGIFAILMMIGACGALFSDSEIDEEVAEEESVHEENEKEAEQVEKVVAKEESEDENEVDGENGSESNENGSDKVDKDEEDISDVEEEEEQEDGNSEEIEVEEVSEEPEESEEEVASSDMLPIYEDILIESFDGLAQVNYLEDSQMFTLLPLDPMFESELEAVVMGYGHDDFQYMVDSLQELSATGVGMIGEGYSIALVNPANVENYIVVVMDGIVIYNALDDL